MPRTPTAERYESKIVRQADTKCHEWSAARDRDGYGIFWGGERYPTGGNKMVKAHRWGYESLHGPIPEGMKVCHSCDNPPCQNPAHWFLGTNADNMADMKTKGRGTGPGRGERHPQAFLTDAQVDAMRAEYTGAYGEQSTIARKYGLNRRTVANLLTGRRR